MAGDSNRFRQLEQINPTRPTGNSTKPVTRATGKRQQFDARDKSNFVVPLPQFGQEGYKIANDFMLASNLAAGNCTEHAVVFRRRGQFARKQIEFQAEFRPAIVQIE